jgi:hypothetical protein
LVSDAHTQGSSFLATLGFATESLWDSKMSKLQDSSLRDDSINSTMVRGLKATATVGSSLCDCFAEMRPDPPAMRPRRERETAIDLMNLFVTFTRP